MKPPSKHLIFATTTEYMRVPAEAVVFITADGNYSSITTAIGQKITITRQLGEIELMINQTLDQYDQPFIRVGKSLIVNCKYITSIHTVRQRMVLSDCRTFRYEVQASKEALKSLKEFLEKEEAI